jgi:hypothetical protein
VPGQKKKRTSSLKHLNPAITLIFYHNKQALPQHEISRITAIPSGEIIDGWQRIFTKFMIPYSTTSAINNTISIELN